MVAALAKHRRCWSGDWRHCWAAGFTHGAEDHGDSDRRSDWRGGEEHQHSRVRSRLLLIRVAETAIGYTWRNLRQELDRGQHAKLTDRVLTIRESPDRCQVGD